MKRTVDILISLPIVLCILPPLCLVVKILQSIQSPGPLISRETRGGLNNLPFRSFNFRITPASRNGGSKGGTTSDPGTYATGWLLRKTSFHRLPEFLNVFFGEMSIVGPRPRSIIHNRRFGEIVQSITAAPSSNRELQVWRRSAVIVGR